MSEASAEPPVPEAPLRIVSLIPSGTEIVAALGWQANLVGRSHECDFPAGITALPVCSWPRIDVTASSRQIDDSVRDAVRNALSIYQIDADQLRLLKPTHIITQMQCEVCAVSRRDVEEALCQLIDVQTKVIAHAPQALDDLWETIRQTAHALGDPERGNELVARLQQRLDVVARAAATPNEPPAVLCVEWIEPLMSAGNWVPELVEIAGGTPLLCQAGEHSPYLTWEDVSACHPDVLVLMPCGFSIERTLAELPPLLSHPGWQQLPAVRAGHVYVTDGHQFFNRPGPRLVESAEILAEIFTAARADAGRDQPFQHYGTGWIRLSDATAITAADVTG